MIATIRAFMPFARRHPPSLLPRRTLITATILLAGGRIAEASGRFTTTHQEFFHGRISEQICTGFRW